jgi:cytochrome P450
MTLVTELDLPVIDLDAAGHAGDGYHRLLADLRERGWLASSAVALLVLDREAGEFFLRSRATAFPGRELADLFGITSGPLRQHIDANILNTRGERHRRLRALVGPAFTPRAADRWRPAMRRFLRQLWDATGAAGSADFVTAVAKPYPSLTIATVLGAPEQDAPRLRQWSGLVQKQFDIRALASSVPDIEQAVTEAREYVEALLRLRRDQPGDDLITSLLAAEDRGDRLSHDECVDLVLNVIAGGVDTTQAQLSHAMRLFAAHPGQWELLAGDPALAARAVEEVLRAEPITPFTARICTEQVEHRGVTFPTGTIVAVCAERANREQERGEEFDITAVRDGRLLTFGAGAHFCLGANLARAELEEALTFLAPRMPGLTADGPARLGGVEGIYGIDELPLRWQPRSGGRRREGGALPGLGP